MSLITRFAMLDKFLGGVLLATALPCDNRRRLLVDWPAAGCSYYSCRWQDDPYYKLQSGL